MKHYNPCPAPSHAVSPKVPNQQAVSLALPTLPAGCGQGSAEAADFDGHATPAAAARALGIELPASILRSVPTRQLEFIAGRVAARAALHAAGLAEPPTLPIGEDRAPLWPPGYVGSITHSAGSAWAVAAPATLMRAVGIDLERIVDAPLMRELGAKVMSRDETLLAVPHWPATRLFSLVFSAKECAYKCLAAHGGRELEFLDLRLVALDAGSASLRLRLLRHCGPLLPEGFELAGGFTAAARQLRTWACWPAR
jgi:enterobactin synthetase component D